MLTTAFKRTRQIDLSVIIPLMEDRDETLTLIQPVICGLREAPRTQLVLIGNGQTGTRVAEKFYTPPGFPKADVGKLPWNVGVAAAWNLGASMAEGEILLYLNDDCVPGGGDANDPHRVERGQELIRRMYGILKDRPDIGIVGVEGHNLKWAGERPINAPDAGCFRGFESFGIDPRRPHWTPPPPEGIETQVITGHCFMVRAADLIECGKFDERYSPAFCEEYALAFEMRQRLGKKSLCMPGIVHHEIGASQLRHAIPALTGYVEIHKHAIFANWELHKRYHGQP